MSSSGAIVDEAAANKAADEVVGIDVADDTDTPINEAAAAPISEPVETTAKNQCCRHVDRWFIR